MGDPILAPKNPIFAKLKLTFLGFPITELYRDTELYNPIKQSRFSTLGDVRHNSESLSANVLMKIREKPIFGNMQGQNMYLLTLKWDEIPSNYMQSPKARWANNNEHIMWGRVPF